MSQFTLAEFRELVAAVSVPMLVMDYRALIKEYSSWPLDELEDWLQDPKHIFAAAGLLGEHTASDAWIRLYGGEDSDGSVPDTLTPMVNSDRYDEYRKNMVAEFTAPFKGIKSMIFEHTVPGPDDTDVTVRSYWKAAGGPENPYARVVVVDLDVTDIRRTEQASQEAADSRSRILRTVGGELRHPLADVSEFSRHLMEEWDRSPESARREMVKSLLDQAQDAVMGLEDLLAGAAAEQRALQVVAHPVDLTGLLINADLKEFRMELEPNCTAIADPLRIRQIVRNLTQNSLKHGGPDRCISCFREDDSIVIQVIDDGPPISPETRARLFEPFSAEDQSGSAGLGLSISKALALAMHGDLVFRDDLSLTTFELRLPTAAKPAARTP